MSVSQSRRLTKQVNIGLTAQEAAAIDAAARKCNVSHAAFARRQVLAAVSVSETTRAHRPLAITSADFETIAALITVFGRAAGAAIHLSQSLRQIGAAHQHREAEDVIAKLREHTGTAARVIERLRDQR